MHIKYTSFYGLKLSIINKNLLFEEIGNVITENRKMVIFGYSLGSIRLLKKFPIMYKFGWENAEVMIIDGRGLYLLGKFLGFPFGDDLSIPELSMELLEISNKNRYSLLLFGTTAEINHKATKALCVKYPCINVHEGIDGFYNDEQEIKIVNEINLVKPDILYVGISSPKKEEFISKWKDKLDVKIILLCGGVIDIIAGDKKKTPNWLKKTGGASLFRFVQEPRRLYKYFFPFIFFMLFKFIPLLFFQVMILKNKEFSLVKHYNLDKT